jgi:pyruvate,water dikinase
MKWWILNLDDGFIHEVNGKYVKVEEIVSIPMRAFWAGFVAKPWEGPPPIDGRGFAAVMFQSTTQTNLNVGVASKFADRNYFMLSKNYCSLNSRLGYHFSTMEAMVSERSGENYIGFQFKGGAADKERREKRVLFIGEILERYGFRVTMNQDNLRARIEGHDQAHMEKRLEILGFLSLHTRQLDMIMTNPARVAYYREKLIRELDELIDF